MVNSIGRKVYLLVKNGYDYTIDKSNLWVIVREYQPEGDFHLHYVLRNAESGERKEIMDYECIVAPDNSQPLLQTITNYLKDNGIYADVSEDSNEDYGHVIRVLIEWGDWKHDHLWCEDLMGYLDYTEIDSQVTEDDGSDTYSAVHRFAKK